MNNWLGFCVNLKVRIIIIGNFGINLCETYAIFYLKNDIGSDVFLTSGLGLIRYSTYNNIRSFDLSIL